MTKRVKPSEKRDALMGGIGLEQSGFPVFARNRPNRREGKLWQRTVIRYFNGRQSTAKQVRPI